jgi:hypothetical protein
MTKILIVMDLRCVLWNVADTCYSLSSDAKSWILKKLLITIVFKPGPVQSPRSGFRPGHRVNLYFKKNSKRRRFSKKNKNKSQRVATGFCRVNPPGRPGHAGSWLILFFNQPGPVPAPGRPSSGSTRQTGPGFQTMLITIVLKPDPVQWSGQMGWPGSTQKKNTYIKHLTNYKFTMQHLYKPNLNFKPTT